MASSWRFLRAAAAAAALAAAASFASASARSLAASRSAASAAAAAASASARSFASAAAIWAASSAASSAASLAACFASLARSLASAFSLAAASCSSCFWYENTRDHGACPPLRGCMAGERHQSVCPSSSIECLHRRTPRCAGWVTLTAAAMPSPPQHDRRSTGRCAAQQTRPCCSVRRPCAANKILVKLKCGVWKRWGAQLGARCSRVHVAGRGFQNLIWAGRCFFEYDLKMPATFDTAVYC